MWQLDRDRCPVHPNVAVALFEAIELHERWRSWEDHTFRMFEKPEWGNIPHSSFHALVKDLKVRGSSSIYHQVAQSHGWILKVPKLPPKRYICLTRISDTERPLPPFNEDAALPAWWEAR